MCWRNMPETGLEIRCGKGIPSGIFSETELSLKKALAIASYMAGYHPGKTWQYYTMPAKFVEYLTKQPGMTRTKLVNTSLSAHIIPCLLNLWNTQKNIYYKISAHRKR